MKNKPLLITGAALLVVVAAAAVYFFVIQKQIQLTPLEKGKGFGSELYEKTGNPADKLPETNPFSQIQANPLQNTNPFEGGKVNPFAK